MCGNFQLVHVVAWLLFACCTAGRGCFGKDPCRGGACFVVCAACKHCKMLAVAKLQAPAEMREPEARFSEANACIRQIWIPQHPMLHVQWHNSFFCSYPGYNILCFGFSKCSVNEQMSLRGIGAGSTEESRSGGEGWTA